MATTETVFIGVDNLTKIRLLTRGRPADLTEVSRMVINIGAVTLDSDLLPNVFDWVSPTDQGEVWLKLGLQFTEAMAATEARITLYDPAHPNGLRWEDDCNNPELLLEACL